MSNSKITLYHANWCGHCKNMVDDLKFLHNGLKNKNFFVGVVDITKNEKVATDFEIRGVPALYEYTSKDLDLKNYEGNRDHSSLLEGICNFTKKTNNKTCCKIKNKVGGGEDNSDINYEYECEE